MTKRLIDFFIAIVGLFFVWPVILICVYVVKKNSEGPGIFRQDRVGLNQSVFECLKIRTMAKGTKQAGTHEVSEASITPAGRWLRSTKVDELPQLINVFKGEMALVGPRPCLPVQEVLVEERANRDVFSVRPGITGLAQVCGVDMSDPILLAKYDHMYIKGRTLLLDMIILMMTFIPKSSRLRHKFANKYRIA